MDRYCRICMRTDLDKDLMVSLYCERRGEVIANMIIDCADVMVSHEDKLPESVCPSCLERLEDAFVLRKLIRDSDASLRTLELKKIESAVAAIEDPLSLEESSGGKIVRKGTGTNAGKIVNYPTEDQIEGIETHDTYNVIRLKGARCCGCDEILPSKEDLKEHCLEKHAEQAAISSRGKVAFQCSTCYERFSNRMKLLNHTKNYDTNEIYHCTTCDILFDVKYRLQQHQSMSKAHRPAPEMVDPDYLEDETAKKRRVSAKKRGGKELKYPKPEFILCIDETPEYQVIHVGGERCCGCKLMFHSYQDLVEHCSEVHPRSEAGESVYECILCFEKFEQVQAYNRHKFARIQKELYYCKFCDLIVDVRYRFDQHLKSSVSHKAAVEQAGITPVPMGEEKSASELKNLESSIETLDIDGIRCCGCDYVCKSQAELDDHSEETHGYERMIDDVAYPYECGICFKRFDQAPLLTYHQNLALQKTIYRCKQCDEQSEIKHRVLQHILSKGHQLEEPAKQSKVAAEQEEPKQHICCFSKCPATFEDANDLLEHVEEKHANKRRENAQERAPDGFICYACHKSFKNERSLHIHQFPRKIDAPNVCQTCGASFIHQATLLTHEKMHIGIREFQCDVCEKAFFDERALKVHKVCHNEDRPHMCDICGKSFLRKGNLKVHKRVHAEKIWDCAHCELKFKTRQALTLHTRYHTGEKPFQCHYCDNRYSHSSDRIRHEMSAHTNRRPHKCNQCDAAFIRKRQLTIHERVHTGERPFVCEICNKGFIQMLGLKQHMKVHQKKDGGGKGDDGEATMKETEYTIKVLRQDGGPYEVVETLEEVEEEEDLMYEVDLKEEAEEYSDEDEDM